MYGIGYLIVAIVQTIIGAAAIVSCVILAVGGEDVLGFIPALLLSAYFTLRGIYDIVLWCKEHKK